MRGIILFQDIIDNIISVGVIDRNIQLPFIVIAQFNIITGLWFQIRITLLIGILIQEEPEWIHIIVIRSFDSSSKGERKIVKLVISITYISCREYLEIGTIKFNFIGDLVAFDICVLSAQSQLHSPFVELLAKIHIGRIYIFFIDEMISS